MDTSSQINWHYETLPKETKKALDFLSTQDWLKNTPWYLAGGTALALQTGNRKSVDLDFFYEDKDFNNDELLREFIDVKEWDPYVNKKNTIFANLFSAKLSFIALPFFVPKQQPLWHGTIRVLDKTDIAVMKIIAVAQRGRKRDFFDLYWCAKNIEPLEEIIKRLKEQYPTTVHDYHHILKSMTYFKDAETDLDPEIFFDADWKKVKDFFTKEIPQITFNVIRIK